jgi:putative transposase
VRDPSHGVVDSHLNRAFNPTQPNQVWAGDITYLRTREGWHYLAIVMDLHSRRIIGWALSAQITTELVLQALQNALVLRQPTQPSGLMLHSDRGSQYTRLRFQQTLALHGIQPAMSGKGACYDNAVVKRFFGSLKHEWLRNLTYFTRADMTQDVQAYIRYYDHQRLHTANGDLAPVVFEQRTFKQVS